MGVALRVDVRMDMQGEAQTNQSIMVIDQVTKRFGGLTAVNRVSISMDKGKVYGLVGPNGAGKTTLFNVLTGFLKPDGGEIYYKSRRITKARPDQVVLAGIGRTFQNLRIFPTLSALDHVMIGYQNQIGGSALGGMFRLWESSEKANRQKALSLLDFFGLKEKAYDAAEDLSYPEQKILILARLLASEAEFLLVDEPTSGLDPAAFKRILAFIRDLVDNQGKTVCVVEHNLDLIREICDWVFFLYHGELIASGTPAELLKRKDLAEIYFGKGGELPKHVP